MVTVGFLALLGAAAAMQPQPMPARTAGAPMSVGATVIRPEPVPSPAIAVERGAVIVREAGYVRVSAEGGVARRTADGTILVTPAGRAPVRLILTY
jgi:hypothetical protein